MTKKEEQKAFDKKQVLGKSYVLFWQICCHNESCDGPEIYRISKIKPENNQECPHCGWIATYGLGIRPIYEMPDDPLVLYELATKEA